MQKKVFVYIINVDWYFQLHWLQRALATLNSGAEVHVLMARTDPEIFRNLTARGLLCHEWRIDRKSLNPLANLARLYDLYRQLKAISPDIIHAITIKPNINTGLVAHLLKAPYVLSVTGTGIIFSGQSMAVRLLRPVVRALYKIANRRTRRKIIFENREDHDYFVRTGLCKASEAVTILGAGVDTAVFRALPENTRQIPKILFAARLLWDKGLGDLVAAGDLLRERGCDFSIEVAGIIDQSTLNAIDHATLQAWHDRGAIHWLGTEKNMPALIAKANIVVLPTYYGEGVPRILIEAAACARAIIATDMPGCREIVRPGINGLRVPPRDVKALADALAVLLRQPELRLKMGRQGRAMVSAEFSEQQVIAETQHIYQGLMA